MASKCCRDKAVVVAVYAEKPQKKSALHHHHHYHQNGSRIDEIRRRGYNRRAELLDYARHLRTPTQSIASLSSHPSFHNKQLSPIEGSVADGTRKKKHSAPPDCMDKWSYVVTNFLKSMMALKTTAVKEKRDHKKSVVKSVKKKVSFFTNLLAALQKRLRR